MALVQNNTAEKTGLLDFPIPASSKADNKADFGKVMQGANAKDVQNSDKQTAQKAAPKAEKAASAKRDAKTVMQEKLASVTSKTQEKITAAGTPVDPEEVQEVVGTLIADIKALLMDAFAVSEEELSDLMAELGIGDMDLLNPELMDQLMLKLTGAEDAVALLFQPELADTLKNVKQEIFALKEEAFAGLKLTKEEAEGILSRLEEAPEKQEVLPKLVSEEKEAPKEHFTEQKTEAEAKPETVKIDGAQSQTEKKDTTGSGREEHLLGRNMQQAVNQVFTQITDAVGEVLPEADAQSVVTQLVERIRVSVNEDTSSFEMQLNPEHLGKINLQVAAKNGVVTAQIATENAAVKEALESQIVTLKENLNNQGIKVEAVEVTVASHEFERNLDSRQDQNQNQQGGQKRRFRFDVLQAAEEELTPADAVIRDMMLANGNQINTTA